MIDIKPLHRRAVLTQLAAGAVSSLAYTAQAGHSLDGTVVRDGNRLRLAWSGAAGTVTIFVSSAADSPPQYMNRVRASLRSDSVDLQFPIEPRPYFLLASSNGDKVRVAERSLPLQGGRNFRDLGGYRSKDGRQVRWGRLYRSGSMAKLTPADLSYLGNLGIRIICDLRSHRERIQEPSPFSGDNAPVVLAHDYDQSSGDRALLSVTTKEQASELMGAGYVDLVRTLAPQFTEMFAHLVRGDAPLAFNCSGGKDRTGMGAALVLSVLDVPRETIVADYALTNAYLPVSENRRQLASGAAEGGLTPEIAKVLRQLPAEVQDVLLGAEPAVMRYALERVDREYGGPVALCKSMLGLNDADVRILQKNYLI